MGEKVMKKTVVTLATLVAVVACGDLGDALDDRTLDPGAQPMKAGRDEPRRTRSS